MNVGDKIENMKSSKADPRRFGYFVNKGNDAHIKGGGPYIRLTDGAGNHWTCSTMPKHRCVFTNHGQPKTTAQKEDQMRMVNPAEQKVLDQIARFRTRTGMAKTMFGKNAVGDANLIGQLEGGRQLRHEMREKIKAFIATYKVKK